MGCGKTSVGREVAAILNREFIDTDVLIEVCKGMRISDIFTESGESAFRKIERKVVADISNLENKVIATGGGTLLDLVNLEIISRNSIIFCLTANIESIYNRLQDSDNRPLLGEKSKRENIKKIYDSRKALYGKLPNQIDTTHLSASETAEVIVGILKKYDRQGEMS